MMTLQQAQNLAKQNPDIVTVRKDNTIVVLQANPSTTRGWRELAQIELKK